MRHVCIGRSTVRWVVFEAAILRRIVGRCDDDAIGLESLLRAVMHKDRARDDRRWRHSIVTLNDGLDLVCREHFQCGTLGWTRKCMGVLAQVKWTFGSFHPPEVTDRLSNCQNMGFGECAP